MYRNVRSCRLPVPVRWQELFDLSGTSLRVPFYDMLNLFYKVAGKAIDSICNILHRMSLIRNPNHTCSPFSSTAGGYLRYFLVCCPVDEFLFELRSFLQEVRMHHIPLVRIHQSPSVFYILSRNLQDRNYTSARNEVLPLRDK